MKYCGLDVSNKSTAICVVNEVGVIEYECSVDTSAAGLKAGLRSFKGLKCVVEASPLAETICGWMEGLKHQIDILDVRQAKAVTATKKKTDRLDARKLAQVCRTGWYTRVHRKSGEARCIRSYLTARMQIVKSATGLLSAIRGLFRAHGIVVPAGDGKKFEAHVRQCLEGREQMLVDAIDPLLRSWKVLRAEERRMYKALDRKTARENPKIKRLMTVPGVGPATAAAFVATIDDPRRFPSGEQVASYIGLVPSIYQSGGIEIKGRITKQGDNLLRWLLVEASTTLLTRSRRKSALKDWGLKLQEAKGFGKARVAVARKLACLLHHLWSTEQTFDAGAAA
jgi:transposase